jgi:hypothetical protein
MFETGSYPEILKNAVITPILKKQDKTSPSAYRPISILPNMDKIVGKLLLNRLDTFLTKHNYHDSHQYGFKKKIGTEHALIDFNYILLKELDICNSVLVAALDLSNAFDRLPHNPLLMKMSRMGVRGIPNKLLGNYLSNRTHSTRVNQSVSTPATTNRGVAQGTVLAPFLFNLQLDDLKNVKLNATMYRYADDIVLLLPCKHSEITNALSKLQIDIERIIEYHKSNGLLINCTKSKFIIFHKNNQKTDPDLSLKLRDGTAIPKVDTFKYLGCTFDTTLAMNAHIDIIIEKIKPIVAVLSRLKWTLTTNVLFKIYFANVHSHLMYAAMVYGNANSSNLKRLQTLQNRALKSVLKLNIDHNTVTLYQHLKGKVLPIKGIQYWAALKWAFKVKRGDFKTNIPISYVNNNLRNNGDFVATSFSSIHGKMNVTYSVLNLFNNLPPAVKNCKNFSQFKANAVKLILNNISHLLTCNRDWSLDI